MACLDGICLKMEPAWARQAGPPPKCTCFWQVPQNKPGSFKTSLAATAARWYSRGCPSPRGSTPSATRWPGGTGRRCPRRRAAARWWLPGPPTPSPTPAPRRTPARASASSSWASASRRATGVPPTAPHRTNPVPRRYAVRASTAGCAADNGTAVPPANLSAAGDRLALAPAPVASLPPRVCYAALLVAPRAPRAGRAWPDPVGGVGCAFPTVCPVRPRRPLPAWVAVPLRGPTAAPVVSPPPRADVPFTVQLQGDDGGLNSLAQGGGEPVGVLT